MAKPSRRAIWIAVALATVVLGGALVAQGMLIPGCSTRTRVVRALDGAFDLDDHHDQDHDRHVDD